MVRKFFKRTLASSCPPSKLHVPGIFSLFSFQIREYRIEVVCMLGGAEFILLKVTHWRRRRQNQLEAIHKATSLGSGMVGLDGKRVFILWAKPVPDAVCVCVCDQMHTGDLDKVQSLST